MDGRHWTSDDFINRLYAGEGGDEAHLATCTDCRGRLAAMREARARDTAQPDVSWELLAAQRRAIYRRLDEKPRRVLAPAVAVAAMLAAGVFYFRPAQEPMTPLGSPEDDRLFAEVYAMEQSAEPVAATPIKALFEQEPL